MQNRAEGDSEVREDLFEHYRFEVDKRQQPLRIDKYVMSRIEGISRSKLQNAAKAGAILVNGEPVKASYKVRPQDVITIVLVVPPRDYRAEPEEIPLDIIHEDEHLIVLNKPAGMVVHPAMGNYTGTLVNALLYHFKNLPGYKSTSAETAETRPGLVHRIDKNTSGLMVVAKDEYAMMHLAKQFFNRTIKRTYIALVWGDFQKDEGTVIGHIGRNLRYRQKMEVFPKGEHGKEAITHYRVIERLGYVTLVECRLETGRTHQIRVHMAYIRHPLFNDATYGGDKIVKGTVYSKYRQFVENCFSGFPRHALHARTLGFVHPATGKEMFFECPPPPDFQNLLQKWRAYFARSSVK